MEYVYPFGHNRSPLQENHEFDWENVVILDEEVQYKKSSV